MPLSIDPDWYGKLWLTSWKKLHLYFKPMADHYIAILRKGGLTKKRAVALCDEALLDALRTWNPKRVQLYTWTLWSLKKTLRHINTERKKE